MPPHVFSIEPGLLAYGCFVPRGSAGSNGAAGYELAAWAEVELPGDLFPPGLLGSPARDAALVEQAVAELLAHPALAERTVDHASLVLPDAWQRVSFTEVAELPDRREARDEVLRWKLKRLVPFRVDDLRIGAAEVTPLPAQEGSEEPRRLLLGFALGGLLEQLEEAFAKAGVWIGHTASSSLALADGMEAPAGLAALARVDDHGYTLVFVRGGEPVLYRFKPAVGSTSEVDRGSLVGRDLKLTARFLDEQLPGEGLERVFLVAPADREPAWSEALAHGLDAPVEPLGRGELPALFGTDAHAGRAGDRGRPGRSDEPLPWHRLAPMLGAAHRRV